MSSGLVLRSLIILICESTRIRHLGSVYTCANGVNLRFQLQLSSYKSDLLEANGSLCVIRVNRSERNVSRFLVLSPYLHKFLKSRKRAISDIAK